MNERRQRGDVGGQLGGRLFQFGGGDDGVHDAVRGHPSRFDGPSREQHLLHEMRIGDLHEIECARQVVRDAETRRRKGECRIDTGHDKVAGENQLACASPDRAFDHGDDRRRVILDVADDFAQRIVVGEGIAAVGGQFADIVARGEDLRPGCGADDDHANLGRLVGDEGRGQVIDEGHAQGIDRRAGQRDPGDRIADLYDN